MSKANRSDGSAGVTAWARGARTGRTRSRIAAVAALAVFCALIRAWSAEAQLVEVISSGASSVARDTPAFYDPVYFWYTQPTCTTSPAITTANPRGVAGEELLPALISRASTSLDTPRTLFSFNPTRGVGVCNPYHLFSEIIRDATHIYYVDNQGPGGHAAIWRRSRTANVEDPSQLLVDLTYELTGAELLVFDRYLFVIVHGPEIFDGILEYDKNTGALINGLVELGAQNTLRNMQYDGRFLYWIGEAGLRRNDTTNGNKITVIPANVSAYYTQGYGEECSPKGCFEYAFLLYAIGNRLYEEDSVDGSVAGIPDYTSTDPNAQILAITRDGTQRYFIERRVTGGGFGVIDDRIYRLPLPPSTATLIYGPVNTIGPGFDSFTTDLEWLYFRDRLAEKFLRIPNNSAALPIHDLVATKLEITQGLQNAGHGQRLIADKPTTVRFYVKSEAPGDSRVPGVTASLSGSTQTAGYLGTLAPINDRQLITVTSAPKRSNLDESFQFELPRHWTNQGPLTLSATVNPGGRVVEDDTADNSTQFGPITFSPSARLHVAYYNFWYAFGGTLFRPSDADVAASQRRMRQLYPIGEPGGSFTGNGLHFTVDTIYDSEMAAHVMRADQGCIDRYPKAADRNQCASDYAHARLQELRQVGWIRPETLPYANIAPATCGGVECLFNRGYAINGVGSGPSDDDNYAAHEIGHLLGRPHPTPGAEACEHSASDDGYPYADAKIEHAFFSEELRYAGLDRRPDGTYAFLDGNGYYDTMAYCKPNWISEYTTEGMYDFLGTRAPQLTSAGRLVSVSLVDGDWLLAGGILDQPSRSGGFTSVRRLDAVADATPPTAGDFTLELLGSSNDVLESYSFAADPIEDTPGRFVFSVVVPFESGAARLRVKENSTGRVLATRDISANAPVVSNLALLGASNPVDGLVGVAWDASDADGDSLKFDVIASRDGGITYRAVALGLDSTSLNLDSTLLGGGTNQLRVVASDGVLTGYDETEPFEVAARAPLPVITDPAEGTQVNWGQLVSFAAEISDKQDDLIPDEDIVWSNAYGEIGIGRSVQTDQLQVGENLVTVTATNSLGESGSASVTVIVGDVLLLRGPRLSVVPETIAWQLGAEITEQQSALLEVANAGGGSLSFDVFSDSDWVTVDNASEVLGASAPASIIVRADPTAVQPATTGLATLTIENRADAEDVAVVLVQLARGNTFDGPPTIEICDLETEECTVGASTTSTTLGAECGDGVSEGGEECDDGDFVRGDACGADCNWVACGDPDDSGSVTATDALVVLRVAVGSDTCAGCVCNVDGAGAAASASDALRVLRAAVGQAGQLACAECAM